MSNVTTINLNQNEISGSNDVLSFLSMTASQSSAIPQELIDAGCTTLGTGTLSNFNAAAKTFDYTCNVNEIPAIGQPDLLIAVAVDVTILNGGCGCDKTAWACLAVPAGDCTGYNTGQISTQWNCFTGLLSKNVNDFIAAGGPSWTGSATITAVSGASINPAQGVVTWDSNSISGYVPTLAELNTAPLNVRLGVQLTPPSPNEDCAGTFLLEIQIPNPCGMITVANVDFS